MTFERKSGDEKGWRYQKTESGIELILELKKGLSFLISKLSLRRMSQLEEGEKEERLVTSIVVIRENAGRCRVYTLLYHLCRKKLIRNILEYAFYHHHLTLLTLSSIEMGGTSTPTCPLGENPCTPYMKITPFWWYFQCFSFC